MYYHIYFNIYATQTIEEHNLKTYRSTPLIQIYGPLCVVFKVIHKKLKSTNFL